jgi:hypothetical protein
VSAEPLKADHLYLVMQSSHLSKGAAVCVALAAIREIVPGMAEGTDTELRRQTYTITSPEGEATERRFDDLVEEARTTGVVSSLRIATDRPDPIFGGSYGIAVSENMNIKTEQFGPAIEIRGPGHTYPVGRELVKDILFYRRETCASSTLAKLAIVGRLYRAYVLSCTTLVEAYLNRQCWYFQAIGHVSQEQIEELPLKFEERIEAWLTLFTTRTITDLKGVKPCWGHLIELRRERNNFAHAPGPTAGLSFHDVHRGLNSARTGIGGLLLTLRKWQGLPPLGFLERLQRAPEVKFVSALVKG